MSQEKIELLRPLLAEWAEGNFWGSAELMASDITFQAAPRANIVAPVWTFRENEVVGVYLEGTRDAALIAAGLPE